MISREDSPIKEERQFGRVSPGLVSYDSYKRLKENKETQDVDADSLRTQVPINERAQNISPAGTIPE